MKIILSLIALLIYSQISLASNVSSLSYSATNVTTSAYVTLVASSPIAVVHLIICDSSGQILKLAKGSAGNEVDLFTVPVNSCFEYSLDTLLGSGTRLSLKAISATASSGYSSVSFLP